MRLCKYNEFKEVKLLKIFNECFNLVRSKFDISKDINEMHPSKILIILSTLEVLKYDKLSEIIFLQLLILILQLLEKEKQS